MSSKVTAQAIVADVMRIQKETGRVPSRAQYELLGAYPGGTITAIFGSYAMMLKASGIQYAVKGKRDKQELRGQEFEHLKKEAEQKKSIVPPPELVHSLLCIGDLHIPYQHPDAIPWLIALNQKYKFQKVVSVGDELDYHAINFHTHDPDILSPGHELDAAIKALQPLYKEFPVMALCDSNHGSMVFRRAKHFGLSARVLKTYGEMIEAPPGWSWHFEIRMQLSSGQRLLVHHSYGASVLMASQRRGDNLISGHIHSKFSLEYWSNEERTFFAGQTGCLVDDTSLALAYNKGSVQRPLLGSIGVFNGVPRALPMFLDKSNRWNGIIP